MGQVVAFFWGVTITAVYSNFDIHNAIYKKLERCKNVCKNN